MYFAELEKQEKVHATMVSKYQVTVVASLNILPLKLEGKHFQVAQVLPMHYIETLSDRRISMSAGHLVLFTKAKEDEKHKRLVSMWRNECAVRGIFCIVCLVSYEEISKSNISIDPLLFNVTLLLQKTGLEKWNQTLFVESGEHSTVLFSNRWSRMSARILYSSIETAFKYIAERVFEYDTKLDGNFALLRKKSASLKVESETMRPILERQYPFVPPVPDIPTSNIIVGECNICWEKGELFLPLLEKTCSPIVMCKECCKGHVEASKYNVKCPITRGSITSFLPLMKMESLLDVEITRTILEGAWERKTSGNRCFLAQSLKNRERGWSSTGPLEDWRSMAEMCVENMDDETECDMLSSSVLSCRELW